STVSRTACACVASPVTGERSRTESRATTRMYGAGRVCGRAPPRLAARLARAGLLDDGREAHHRVLPGGDQAADEYHRAAGLDHLARRLDQGAFRHRANELAVEGGGDAVALGQHVAGDHEQGEVGEGHDAAAVHEAAAVHVLLLGAEGAAGPALLVLPPVEGPGVVLEGIAAHEVVPAGPLALGDRLQAPDLTLLAAVHRVQPLPPPARRAKRLRPPGSDTSLPAVENSRPRGVVGEER